MLTIGLITTYKAHMWHGTTPRFYTQLFQRVKAVLLLYKEACFGFRGVPWSPVTGFSMMCEETQKTLSTQSSINSNFNFEVRKHFSIEDNWNFSMQNGSNYFKKTPFVSDYTIIPPKIVKQNNGAFQGLFSSRERRIKTKSAELKQNTKTEEELEGQEKDNYGCLTEEMSRIYTSAPRIHIY
ncbi:hypothetical protein IFM89_039403 [Coptis chinensis]|uniref:Uncharacterized protein n=1 Tax=Coptis chinensis TaxID=261450 RepID=A0A835LP12_9MAGN|nr:hypothetical protein IFM89_039403 [Coptis chinensis]